MEWRSVPGYEGYYSVSDEGQVRSELRYVPHLHGPKRVDERLLRHNIDKYGYATVVLQRESSTKTFKVHRLVLMSFTHDSDLTVNHKDLNKLNNNLSNLEYMSSVENSEHRRRNGPPIKRVRGVDHHCTKLSPGDIEEIRELVKLRISRKAIAERFGIHPMTTYKVTKKVTV